MNGMTKLAAIGPDAMLPESKANICIDFWHEKLERQSQCVKGYKVVQKIEPKIGTNCLQRHATSNRESQDRQNSLRGNDSFADIFDLFYKDVNGRLR
jgi:hypothetical protein